MFKLLLILSKLLLHMSGLLCWFLLLLLLMQVVVCKDARALNIVKFLSATRKRRWKIFRRNLSNRFYASSLALFFIAMVASLKLIFELYSNYFPEKNWIWLLFQPVIAFSIYRLYGAFGYKIELFTRFKQFWKGEHE